MVIREGRWEERGFLEGGIVPTEPDMVAGVNAERRDVLLEAAQLDSRFAELMQSLDLCVVSFCDVASACNLKSCHSCV